DVRSYFVDFRIAAMINRDIWVGGVNTQLSERKTIEASRAGGKSASGFLEVSFLQASGQCDGRGLRIAVGEVPCVRLDNNVLVLGAIRGLAETVSSADPGDSSKYSKEAESVRCTLNGKGSQWIGSTTLDKRLALRVGERELDLDRNEGGTGVKLPSAGKWLNASKLESKLERSFEFPQVIANGQWKWLMASSGYYNFNYWDVKSHVYDLERIL
ncbi:7225_t:CDS:2, partial [Ambispora leptoticha]